jgi:hypothetical protein
MFEDKETRETSIKALKSLHSLSCLFLGLSMVCAGGFDLLGITNPSCLKLMVCSYLTSLMVFMIHLSLHGELVITISRELLQEVCTLCEKDAKAGINPMIRFSIYERKINTVVMLFNICRYEWSLPEEIKK